MVIDEDLEFASTCFGSLWQFLQFSASDTIHLYTLQSHHNNILYVGSWVACCTICSTTYDLVLGDSVVTFCDRIFVAASLINLPYVILGSDFDLYFRVVIRWFTMYFTFQLYLYTYWIRSILDIRTCFSFTEHGYARLRHELSLWFLSLVFGRLKSGEVLSSPCRFFLCT